MKPSHLGKTSVWTIMELLRWSTDYFKSHEIESPRAASEILLSHSLGLQRIDLYLKYDKPLTPKELENYKSLIKRRVRREPVAYIVGEKEFWSLPFKVSPSVLIPRPETECLVEEVFSLFEKGERKGPLRILELGVGSGAITVTLASRATQHYYFASDISYEAINVASENAERHKVSKNIRFMVGDWLSSLNPQASRMDFIISNPPYIKRGDIVGLQEEIRSFEPVIALDGDDDGLSAIREIMDTGRSHLCEGGMMLIEIGADQGESVIRIAHDLGSFDVIALLKDYSLRHRILKLRKGGSEKSNGAIR